MYRKILISGVTAAAILGAGGTALALSGSDATSGSPSASATSAKAAPAGKHTGREGRLLKRLSHGQFVLKDKDGKYVTHDLIHGTVTAVSPTSITVQAADKTSETFSISKTTKVREHTVRAKGAGKKAGKTAGTGASKPAAKAAGSASSIAKIAKGDNVIVAGTGTSNYAAQHIIELVK